jgi:hypothetical protein
MMRGSPIFVTVGLWLAAACTIEEVEELPPAPAIQISSLDLYFGSAGYVPCGTTATPQTVSIANTGSADLVWKGVLGPGADSAFLVEPTSGILAPGASATVSFTPAALPKTSATTTDMAGGSFTITTNVDGDKPHAVQLHQTAEGAVIATSSSSVDFGAVLVTTTAHANVQLTNAGNRRSILTAAIGGPDAALFDLAPAGKLTIDPGSSLSLDTTFSPGLDFTTQRSAVIAFQAQDGDTLCAPLQPLVLTGAGALATIAVSPPSLDFGEVDCGKVGAAKTVTIANNGNGLATFSAGLALGASSPFTVSPASGTVAKGKQLTLTVTPHSIPTSSAVTPNLYGDVLSITTDASGDVTHQVTLTETARGAILALPFNTLPFGSVAVNAPVQRELEVVNIGNAPATVSVSPATNAFTVPQNVAVKAADVQTLQVSFTPAAAQKYSDMAQIAVSKDTVLCQPLPASKLSLTGIGVSKVSAATSQPSLNFGSVSCGTQASAQKIIVANTSAQAAMLTYDLATTNYTVVDNCGGMVPGGNPGLCTVTVTPAPIPVNSSTMIDAFADTLTIGVTNATLAELHPVQLHESARGAIVSWVPNTLGFHGSNTRSQGLFNAGNAPVDCQLALGGAAAAEFKFEPPSTSVVGKSLASLAALFIPPANCSGTHNATLTITSQSVLCAPLPASAQWVGNCK